MCMLWTAVNACNDNLIIYSASCVVQCHCVNEITTITPDSVGPTRPTFYNVLHIL